MTSRDKAIEQAAESHRVDGAGPSDICHNCQAFKYASFIAGTRYADENPIIRAYTSNCDSDEFHYERLEANLKIATEALEAIAGLNDNDPYYMEPARIALQRIRE